MSMIPASDLRPGDRFAVMIEPEDDLADVLDAERVELTALTVTTMAPADAPHDARTRVIVHGVGAIDTCPMDFSAEGRVELLARAQTIAQADYRFAAGGDLWPVELAIYRRDGEPDFVLRTLETLAQYPHEVSFRAGELETILPEREDEGEIGYLAARAALLDAFRAYLKSPDGRVVATAWYRTGTELQHVSWMIRRNETDDGFNVMHNGDAKGRPLELTRFRTLEELEQIIPPHGDSEDVGYEAGRADLLEQFAKALPR